MFNKSWVGLWTKESDSSGSLLTSRAIGRRVKCKHSQLDLGRTEQGSGPRWTTCGCLQWSSTCTLQRHAQVHLVVFQCAGTNWHPLPNLWVPPYWQMTTDSSWIPWRKGVVEVGKGYTQKVLFWSVPFLWEVGTRAGHGTCGERCFPVLSSRTSSWVMGMFGRWAGTSWRRHSSTHGKLWPRKVVDLLFQRAKAGLQLDWAYTLQQWSLTSVGSSIPMRADTSYGSFLQKEKRETACLWVVCCQPTDPDLRATGFSSVVMFCTPEGV